MNAEPAPSNLRVFCAIDVPAEVIGTLRARQDELKHILRRSRVSWPRPGNTHLTLVFLGDVPAPSIPEVGDAIADACRDSPQLHLQTAGRGCFPSAHNPRVLWIGVEDPAGHLAMLESRLQNTLRQFIADPEHRKFHPHLTLARIKELDRHERLDLRKWLAASGHEPVAWTAAAVKLYSSRLSSEGSEYSVLAEHALGCH